MDLGIRGKKALVTGGSRGLGRAVARELAREGARVVLASRNEEAAERTASDIARETGSEVRGWRCDVTQASEIRKLVDRTSDVLGGIDLLLCNAGGPKSGTFDTLNDDDWQKAFDTNLLSVVRLIRETLPHMDTGGRILAIASSSVKQPIPGLILSNAMRAGVAGLMKTLSEELGSRGILVNTLCPGRIATDRLQELDRNKSEKEGVPVEEIKRASLADIPLGRYGEPEEFARVAAFLLSGANTYITGSALMVDGGMVKAL
ncbi:3-oxoacyl-[acyl-carrier protein] reductase [Melghirimyces profundicolus]|uniref:3-oxoacyl-[acyl-carrier protein] reductase n=1 Tax=Melghirimyces profundicolus TaxID=1242148 RepID=A0A2T6BQH0_9BACL|nr:SDR family oxidoreductase [Melghirimyces profundicolus]PTX58318.1 3-oxoacyl-[acyl-carrier protein] reductase [Melghirimyces profundicolus]